MPIRFFEVWSLALELKGELFWSSERGALRLEGVCGTVFGGRFWSSERGALRLEGVPNLSFDRQLVTASETGFEPSTTGM